MAGKKRGNIRTPLGKHRMEAHDSDDFDVKCTILGHEVEISARKALEVAWIYTKNPTMNSRNECISITSDLISFLSLGER